MPNLFDQFDVESEVKDLATSFGVGSNQLLKMGGDAYGLATGNMDNVVSRRGQENIDYLQRGKSKKLTDAEARRNAAVDAKSGIVDQALAYAKETFTDPRLLLSSTVEAIPSLIGAGGAGAGARAVTGRVLAKKGAQKAAETAAKVGVGTAVATGSGMQGTSVGAEQYSEVTDILSKMSDEKAMAVPEIARLMSENGYSLEKAKKELTLGLARSTGALATIASLVTQIVPGGRTIEQALVGGAGKKVTGKGLAQRGVGVVRGLLGEPTQEGSEEGSGAYLKNLTARAVEPERDLTKGVGAAIGAGVAGTALIGAAAGTTAASRPSRPVSEGETTAGMSSEPLASDATSIPVLEATTEYPSISLRDVENMSPEQFAATIDARDAISRGAEPRPEDVTTLEGMRRPPVTETDVSIAPVQEALDEWRTQNPDVGVNITVINDPNMRNTRNYGIRGYFDPNTGEVVINSAFTKPFEVESVVNHEWSHHTLSSEEGRAALVEFATRDIPQEELDALAKRYPNADNLTLVEEWIARNQEKSPGTFARIIAKIREWLNGKLGINMSNEEVARVMLRTLRERGAPVAEGSGEMRQSTTEQPISISERRAEALRAFKERNPRSDAVMDKGRLYSPKVRDRLKTLSSTGVVDRQALDSDVETNFPAASRVEIPTEETLPTLDEIRNAVDEPKRSKVGGAGNIPEGDLITVRQDVPAYTKYGVGVVTVRDSKGNTYYQPMVRFTDPVLKPTPRQEGIALFIGSGEDKDPAITVKGRMSLDQSMPPDLDTWTQVGYNPDRHSYMYDRETGDPVLSGSEAVQIGNTVFVKDPEFGQKKDFKYSVEDEPLDTASENLNKTPNEATSIQQEEPRPARALPKSRFYVSSDERGGDFAGAITEAARLHKKGAAVEVKSPEFYSDPENHLYFSEDGLAGAVVKPDGDLVSVFKHPDSTAKMRDILTDASQEATKLDGFDIDEFLPNYYSRFGFRPVARVTFNDDFAPPKWNFEENGRPDNVFMVRDPENKLGLPEYDAYSEVRDSVPLVSYEEALTLQQEAVDKVASEKPKGAVLASEKPSVSGQSNVLSPSATDTVTMKPFKYSVEDEPKAGSKKAVRTPNEAVRKLSDDYNAQMGLGPIKHGHYINFDEATARKIAKAYDAMPEIDRSPETVKAYEALAKEVNDQWDFAVENLGITFEPWNEDGQPYANSREMMADVRNNNHLYFFRGGGKHEFMSQVDPETGLTSIDKLRAIHDLYGHAAEDYQFGPRGEENAWLKHSQMFTPEAQRALSVGTRGQNSWVNFGDQNYENGVNKNIPAKDRPYAPQKMALLPEELTDWRSALAQSEPERSSVLAKQPIRESLTDEPVERVPEEGDPDYEEIEDTESALGAAANVRERDDLSPTSALNTLYAKKSAVPVPTTGKRTNGQVAEQLRQAAIAYWGKELSSSNLTEEDIARLVDNGVEEVLAGLKASNHAGNWYTTAIRKAMAIAGVLHPELTDDALAQKAGFKDAHAAEVGLAAAMAITSQNLNVEKNTAYANDQFNILKKTGRFDPSKVYGSKAEAISGNLELANVLLDKVGWDGMEGFLNREYTLKQLSDVASQLLGQKISITGKVDDVVNGSAIFGPKIGGGFFQNLRGNFNPVTVDLWMRRTWGRWTGNVLPDPLDAKRLARMIDGMRESGIQLPEELRSIRTITAKKGRKVPTLSDATAERVLSDPQAVTAAYDFAALHEARWNKIYSEVRQNITPEQAEAIRNGSLSLEELNRQQQKSLRQKRDAWQDLEDRPSISTKEGKAAQKELFATMDAEAGRTAILTNEELSDNKPEWAKSARVIKTLLKPIDVPSDIDRRAIVDVVNRIRNELDRQGVSATNADIQAILWYPEKDLWAKLAGKKESNLKNSYDEEFLRVAESQGLGNEARSASAKVGD